MGDHELLCIYGSPATGSGLSFAGACWNTKVFRLDQRNSVAETVLLLGMRWQS